MNTYLIVVVRDAGALSSGKPGEIVYFRVIDSVSAADAKAACAELEDRRPGYLAFTIKMS